MEEHSNIRAIILMRDVKALGGLKRFMRLIVL